MSKVEKLIEQLKSRPKDFTWDEAVKVLNYYGYKQLAQGRTGGSRRKFVNDNKDVISLHEPHPQKVLKGYQLDIIIEHLKLENMKNYLEYKNYIGTVEFSADDKVFWGKIHGINDLVTFEGASVMELEAAFNDSVEDYLETCITLNKIPDKVFKGSFNVRLPGNLHRNAALLATRKGLNINEIVKIALSYVVEHEEILNNKNLALQE